MLLADVSHSFFIENEHGGILIGFNLKYIHIISSNLLFRSSLFNQNCNGMYNVVRGFPIELLEHNRGVLPTILLYVVLMLNGNVN